MNLGVIPLALSFGIKVTAWMVNERIGAAVAAQKAAADFDYFKRVSDAELTEIAFEMAEQHPEIPYWEWFKLLQNIRKYGMRSEPTPEPTPPPVEKAGISGAWIWVGVGLAVLLLVTGR